MKYEIWKYKIEFFEPYLSQVSVINQSRISMIKIPKIYWTILNHNTEHIANVLAKEHNQVTENNNRLNQTTDKIDELCQRLTEIAGWDDEKIRSEMDASWLMSYSTVTVKSARLYPVNYYLRKQAVYSMQEIAKDLPDAKTTTISASLWRIMVKKLRANIRRINSIRQYSNRVNADCKVAEKQLKHFCNILSDLQEGGENSEN